MTKKCPLLLASLISRDDGYYRSQLGDANCRESDCGWWNSPAFNCGLAIATVVTVKPMVPQLEDIIGDELN